MADLIDRQALMQNFCGYDLNECVKYGNKTAEQQNNSYSTMMMYEIAYEIEDAPAVDAVEVVRCKDCKHRADDLCNLKMLGIVRANDFCSYGERREQQ